MQSILERMGISKGWRLVAAILIVVLVPVWLPLFLLSFALVGKIFPLIQDAAKLEQAWTPRKWRRRQIDAQSDSEPHSENKPRGPE